MPWPAGSDDCWRWRTSAPKSSEWPEPRTEWTRNGYRPHRTPRIDRIDTVVGHCRRRPSVRGRARHLSIFRRILWIKEEPRSEERRVGKDCSKQKAAVLHGE